MTSRKLLNATTSGGGAIVVSNLAMTGAIMAMKHGTPPVSLAIIGLGNLLAVGFNWKSSGATRSLSSKERILTFGWALSYVGIYSIVALAHQALSLSQIIISESLVPLLAALTVVKVTDDLRGFFRECAPVALLLGISWIRSLDNSASPAQTQAVFILVAALFYFSQIFSRALVNSQTPRARTQIHLNLIAGLLLTSLAACNGALNVPLSQYVGWSLVFAATTVLCQRMFLIGLLTVPPIAAALWISTSVPIGTLADVMNQGILIGQKGVEASSLIILSIVYCAIIGLRSNNHQSTEINTYQNAA